MAKDLTLIAFKAEMLAAIDRFTENWCEQNIADPEGWPMAMPLADWDEQFVLWFDDPPT